MPFASRLLFRIFIEHTGLPTETKVECETSQSKRGTSVNLGNSGFRCQLNFRRSVTPWLFLMSEVPLHLDGGDGEGLGDDEAVAVAEAPARLEHQVYIYICIYIYKSY